MIGDNIEVVVLGTEGDTVRLGITAPKDVDVFRKEIYISIQQANEESSKSTVNLAELNRFFFKKKVKINEYPLHFLE